MVIALNSQNEMRTKVVELRVRRELPSDIRGAGMARRTKSGSRLPLMKCSKQVLGRPLNSPPKPFSHHLGASLVGKSKCAYVSFWPWLNNQGRGRARKGSWSWPPNHALPPSRTWGALPDLAGAGTAPTRHWSRTRQLLEKREGKVPLCRYFSGEQCWGGHRWASDCQTSEAALP